MALITISGYPSSGKSTRAAQLKDYLDKKIQDDVLKYQVVLVSDHSLSIDRASYNDSRSEKPARAMLFSSLQRLLSRDTFLIVDAPNYIKGFRYQMYCAARELRVRVCTLYVVATQDLCRHWNESRPPEESYSTETLENMFLRYEEPSSMVRWDSPLFTISWSDSTLPFDDIWSAITSGTIKPPNSGTLTTAKAPTDALSILEVTTNSLVSAIISAQAISGGSTTVKVDIAHRPSISLPDRVITLPELQRLKRQFITMHRKAVTLGTTEKGAVDWDEEKVVSKFVTFLEEHFQS